MENENMEEIEEENTLEKPKKRKSNFVMTEARKEAFEKTSIKRAENIELKKKEKIVKKAEQIKKKEIKERKILSKYIEPEPEPEPESDDEPEIIIKKVKKPRKKIILVETDSEDDEIKVRKPKQNKTINQATTSYQQSQQSQLQVRFI